MDRTVRRRISCKRALIAALPLALIVCAVGCGDDDSGGSTGAMIDSPADESVLPADGVTVAQLGFGSTLTAQSVVRVLLFDSVTLRCCGTDITALFLPEGASDFSGLREATAELSPEHGLFVGLSTLTVDVDADGDGSFETTASSDFEWAPCDPFDQTRCYFPFPNDYYTIADSGSPTGRHLGLSASQSPTNAMGVPVDPSRINELDGFSTGPLLLTHIPDVDLVVTGAPLQTNIARSLEPDTPIALIDAETGERQLIWIERDQSGPREDQRPLMIRVARNLPNGRRYVAALSSLRDSSGTLLEAAPSFVVYRDDLASESLAVEARRPHMENIFEILGSAGIPRENLFLAWDFTTQSVESVSANLLHIRDDAFDNVLGDAAPDFEILSIEEPLDDKIFRRIDGTFQSPLYLTNGGVPGSNLRFGPDGMPANEGDFFTARFRCIVPWSATTAGAAPAVPARLSLYGHGLLGSEGETSSSHVRDMASEHNFVICGTRWTGFEEDDLPFVVNLILDFSNFPAFIDRQHQGVLNFMMLGRLLLHADGFSSHPAFQVGGESVLDTSDLFYDGNSQGGILGGVLAAFAQDIERFVLGVPGINYSTLLRRSIDFDPFNDILEGSYSNGFDRALLISAAQTMWDRTDPSGHVNHVTGDTYAKTPPKKILYQVAFADHQVAQLTADIAARNVGARIHQPALPADKETPEEQPYFGIPAIESYPYDGSAIVIWHSGNPYPPLGNTAPRGPLEGEPGFEDLSPCAAGRGADPHECPRRSPAGRMQKSEFLRTDGAVIDVCDGGPCFTP